MGFDGFPRGGDRFFAQLAAEQSREWFAAHKQDYERLWLHPMQALLDEVAARIAPAYEGLGLAAPKVFRIHRDVRFSKDKAPYKTHIAGVIKAGKRAADTVMDQPAAVYVSLGDGEEAGAGIYMLDGEQVTRWRKRLLDPKKGAEVGKLVAAARKKKWEVVAAEELTRPPRGFPDDHPRLDLARLKGCCVMFAEMPRGMLHEPALAGWLAKQARDAAPLVTWLARNVA